MSPKRVGGVGKNKLVFARDGGSGAEEERSGGKKVKIQKLTEIMGVWQVG